MSLEPKAGSDRLGGSRATDKVVRNPLNSHISRFRAAAARNGSHGLLPFRTERRMILPSINQKGTCVRHYHPTLLFRSFLLSALLSLAACNPPQPLNFSVQNMRVSPVVADADLRGITVTPAAPNERTGALPPAVASITNTWKEATQEALARTAIFNDDSRHHINLEIKILKLDAPAFGVTFPTDTAASYTIVDRNTGAILFTQVINGLGETPLDFAFAGAIRARESINRSVQNNIAAFIDALERSPLTTARIARSTS